VPSAPAGSCGRSDTSPPPRPPWWHRPPPS
jgi:hypothetical protein